MPESLQDLLSRLREDRSLFQSVEQAVRQGVILPILARLGWDTDNVREVVPEFDVGGRQVDYCLRVKEKNAVFIEVKRLSENLDREEHQAQLLDYAFREGVEIAILTNGLSWWLYLPLLKGSWTQRKFFAIDIRQQNVEAAAKHFGQFLGHDAISNGSAVERARSMHASREKARLIDQTVPRAWNQLCQEPDELLLELLADKVESLCGHRPESEPLAEFVAKYAVGAYQDMNAQQPGPADPPRPMSLRKLRPSGSELRQGVYTFTKPRAFIFKGKRVPVSSFRDVLIGLCLALYQAHSTDFLGRIKDLRGRTRAYFSRDPHGMTNPQEIPGTGIYAEANLSANDIVKKCYDLIRVFSYSSDQLHIEVEGRSAPSSF